MIDLNVQSVRVIAKKDFQDAVRSYLFWGMSAFFCLLILLPAVLLWWLEGDLTAEGATTEGLIALTYNSSQWILPLIAAVVGWKTIVGERESGSLNVLLGLPHSRADVVVGKAIGRGAVLVVSLFVGFGTAALFVAVLFGGFDVSDYVGLFLASALYGLAFLSVFIAISTISRAWTVAVGGVVATWIMFSVGWYGMLPMIEMLANRGYGSMVTVTLEINGDEIDVERHRSWAYFIHHLSPAISFPNSLSYMTSVAELDPDAQEIQDSLFDGSVPFYLRDWFSLVILKFWILAPIAFSVYYFQRDDL